MIRPNPPSKTAQLERLTQRYGRRLFRGIARHESRLPGPEQAQNALMNLLMKDEDLRYRMLRFVDVFPALKNPREVSKHLEEYLVAEELATGVAPTRLSEVARTFGKRRRTTERAISTASRIGISRMGKQFIAGNTPREVADRIRRLEGEGFLFSLDLLGEFVASESQADLFQKRYMEMISDFEALLGGRPPKSQKRNAGPRVNVSIKLSSLTSKFDPADAEGTSRSVRDRLRPLMRAAMERNVFLNIDMEKREFRDTTLRIILDLLDEEEFRGYEHIGTVHQAYLLDAEETLRRFLRELEHRNQPMTIRLVKGAYWDSEQIWARQKGWPVPVYTDKRETDAAFERCVRILLENHRSVRTAIASHNVRSIAWALALKEGLSVPDDRLEFQTLYGMAGPIQEAIRDLGFPVRIYTPCGELIPGMSYLVRRILENTSNESFLRQRFSKGADEGSLLANPKSAPRQEWRPVRPTAKGNGK